MPRPIFEALEIIRICMRKVIHKKVSSWEGLHKALNISKGEAGWVYRGQSDASWALVPKIGRPPYSLDKEAEQKAFDFWVRECAHSLDSHKNSPIELLAMGQHHGLATRLLDWSYSPLSAAYFASINNIETDAVLYMYKTNQEIDNHSDPFKITGTPLYKPGTIGQRIISQQGLFTVHSQPEYSMLDHLQPNDKLVKIVINKNYAADLAFDLDRYGVNTMTMFPDLDGVAQYIDWAISHRIKWGK